jgi:hypothetical protein
LESSPARAGRQSSLDRSRGRRRRGGERETTPKGCARQAENQRNCPKNMEV